MSTQPDHPHASPQDGDSVPTTPTNPKPSRDPQHLPQTPPESPETRKSRGDSTEHTIDNSNAMDQSKQQHGLETPPESPASSHAKTTGPDDAPTSAPMSVDSRITDSDQASTSAPMSTDPGTFDNTQKLHGSADDADRFTPVLTRRQSEIVVVKDSYSLQKLSQLGEGQWSTVYRAKLSTTPINASGVGEVEYAPKNFALKVPRSKWAARVVRDEASLLEDIFTQRGAEQFVVPFYGWNEHSQGIVLDEMPLTLDDLSSAWRRSCVPAQKHLAGITTQLVNGLAFLHNVRVVHADIKPSNILVRPRMPMPATGASDGDSVLSQYHPYFGDFSASVRLSEGSDSAAPRSDAGFTYDYMSPELFSLDEPQSWPSIKSDVYALGVSLVEVALGHNPFDGIQHGLLRRSMCMRGGVLSIAKQMHGLVLDDPTWVNGALEKSVEQRWTSEQWRQTLESRGWSF